MNRVLLARRFVLALSFISLFAASTALADTTQPPEVSSFTVSPSYVSSGASSTIAWVGAWTASGIDLYFNCPSGVTVAVNGSSFPCNTSRSYSGNLSDSGSFTFNNLSGYQQYVQVTAYPKDSSGADYQPGAQSQTLLIGAASGLVTGFSFSASTTVSGAPLTISWTGSDPLGVNVEFTCNPTVQILVGSTTVACNKPAFLQDLGQSGSTTISFLNNSSQSAVIQAYLVPETGSGSYDLTHSLTGTITIEPASWAPAPSTTGFSSSQPSIVSGVPFSLSWTTANAIGANIEAFCSNLSTSLFVVSGTTTTPASCNSPIFTPALGVSGSTTLEVVSQSPNASIGLELLPEGSGGVYLGAAARTLSLSILPAGSQAPAAQSQPSAQAPSSGLSHYTFTRFLQKGSSNADVTALQKFLALDPSIYPSGLVTGYFGPATQQAVGLFQQKHGIATPGDQGYGSVGPKTRAALNSLQ